MEISEALIEQVFLCVSERISADLLRRDPCRVGKILARCVAAALEREEEKNLREDIAKASRHLHALGFFPGTSGNISARIGEEGMLITPSGRNKGELTSEEIVMSDLAGMSPHPALSPSCGEEGGSMSPHPGGRLEPSSEIKMHIAIYRARSDAKAAVHAHPPFATGFAAAHVPLDRPVLPEAIMVLGRIPLVEYGTPSTWELPRALEPHLKEHHAFLLANHGALTIGGDLAQAVHRMETLELFAKVILIARMLGGEKILRAEDLEKIASLSR
jgi:L-fuculose-phosphate aldolase